MTLLTGMFSALSFVLAASEVSFEFDRSSIIKQSSDVGEKRAWGRGILWAFVRGFVGIFFRVRVR